MSYMSISKPTRLLYAASTKCPLMRYFSGLDVPDAFIGLWHKDKKIGLFHVLERKRAEKESTLDTILSYEEWAEKARHQAKNQTVRVSDVIKALAGAYRIQSFLIPADFPAQIAFELQALGFSINVAPEPFFPEQLIKSQLECQAIQAANRVVSQAFKAVEHILQSAVIKKNGYLYDGKKQLTSEYVRFRIDQICLEYGAVGASIVAGGAQACDPHCLGYGPLRAHELIIVDIFPRMKTSGYHGDMTRTFLKGQASTAQKKLVQTVKKAQQAAIAAVKPGIPTSSVHQAVVEVYDACGYATDLKAATGFIHSTGHGLGLALHELPQIRPATAATLQVGHVFTVEPGLYYPQLGACRIEDVVVVTSNGAELLSRYPYRWQLP